MPDSTQTRPPEPSAQTNRLKLAETVFCVQRQSRPVSLQQGNVLDWIYGILFIRYFFSWLADFLWVMQMPVRYNKNIFLCHGSNRVRAGPGKPGKSSKFIMAFSRTGKSWKKATGPVKFWKSV